MKRFLEMIIQFVNWVDNSDFDFGFWIAAAFGAAGVSFCLWLSFQFYFY